MKGSERTRNLIGALLVALLLGSVAYAQSTPRIRPGRIADLIRPARTADLDARHAWSTAGSTGVVGQRDLGKVMTRNTLARFDPSAPDGSAKLLYNVLATDALVGTMCATCEKNSWRLELTFRDTGANDRVRVFLEQTPLDGRPVSTILLSFDSDDLEAAASTAFRSAAVEAAGFSLDFENNIYNLVVVLTKYGDTIGATFNGAVLKPVSYDG